MTALDGKKTPYVVQVRVPIDYTEGLLRFLILRSTYLEVDVIPYAIYPALFRCDNLS
jgi:hypothetical protein